MEAKMSIKVVVINGPNLNLLGKREPEVYGSLTLEEINREIEKEAEKIGAEVTFHQTNLEGEIVNLIQAAPNEFDAVIINPAGYSHTSVAILDAILGIDIPVVEVHLSNIHSREEFRHRSITARGAIGTISGFGSFGYIMALEAIVERLKEEK